MEEAAPGTLEAGEERDFCPLAPRFMPVGLVPQGGNCPWLCAPLDPRQDASPQGFIPVLPTLLLLQAFNGKGSGSDSLGNPQPHPTQFLLECHERCDTEN